MAKECTITVDFVDENGEPKQNVFTSEYDETETNVFVSIEFVSENNGGPIMRPKKPRI